MTIEKIENGEYIFGNNMGHTTIESGNKWHLVEQKPAEWSEEDEMFVHGLIRGLAAKRDIHGHTTFSSDCIDITKTIDWLKSLRPQKQWKPSEEQITWLYRAADDASKDSRMKQILNELLSDLKKLRKE